MKRPNAAKHGFTITSSSLDYKNPYMEVMKHDLVLPDGKTSTYWVMERGDFSVVIPVFPDKTTLLVGQYRVAPDYFSWEFPMGFVKDAEPLAMAKQELAEETGYQANRWKQLGSYYPTPGSTSRRAHVFLAEELTPGEKHEEETEFLQTKQVSLNEVKQMLASGQILDGQTIAAYHYLEAFWEKNS